MCEQMNKCHPDGTIVTFNYKILSHRPGMSTVSFLKVMLLHQSTLSQSHVSASEMVSFLKVMSLHKRWYPFSKSCLCIRDGTLSQSHVCIRDSTLSQSHVSTLEMVSFLKVMLLHQRWYPFSKSCHVLFLKVMLLHQRWLPFSKSLHQRWYPFSKSCLCIRDGTLSQMKITITPFKILEIAVYFTKSQDSVI